MRVIVVLCLILSGCDASLLFGLSAGLNTNRRNGLFYKNADKKPCLQYIKSPEPWQKKESWDLICDKYKEDDASK
jgi:hypothetical protein